jgi:hypothetical protein
MVTSAAWSGTCLCPSERVSCLSVSPLWVEDRVVAVQADAGELLFGGFLETWAGCDPAGFGDVDDVQDPLNL